MPPLEPRLPNDDAYSDFNEAVKVSNPTVDPKEIAHMWACKFGENDGPNWIWILELKDGTFGYLSAGCDYTGWDCQAGGSYVGGFDSPQTALAAVPDDYNLNAEGRANLLAQIDGTQPYALT